MVEQEATIQGIKMSKGVELVLVTKQEIIILPKVKPIITQGIHVVVKVKYSKPIFN